MKKVTAMALMGLMALSVGLSAGREIPLSVSTTTTTGQRANIGVSVLYGRTALGDLQQVIVNPDGSMSTSAPSGGAASAVTVIANTALNTIVDNDGNSFVSYAGDSAENDADALKAGTLLGVASKHFMRRYNGAADDLPVVGHDVAGVGLVGINVVMGTGGNIASLLNPTSNSSGGTINALRTASELRARYDTGADAISDGDYGHLRMNSSRELYTEVTALPTGTSATEVQGVDAAGAGITGKPVLLGADNGSNVAVELQAHPAGILVNSFVTGLTDGATNANQAGLVTLGSGAAPLTVYGWYFNGTTWDRVRGDTTGMYTVPKVSDGSAAVYVTGPAGVLPATPLIVNQAAPGYIPSDQPVSLLAGSNNVGIVELGGNGAYIGVTVTTALPAGSNNIGDVDVLSLPSIPAGANNIGDVDLASAIPAGSNNIGDVDIASALPAGSNNIGDVDVLTLPALAAGTNVIGAVGVTNTAGHQTSRMMDNTKQVTPKFAVIDVASSGDNTIVAAVTGKKIRVLSYVLVAAGAVNVRFESGASGTALSGQMNLTTNSGASSGYSPVGQFETAVGALLNLELSGAVSVDGHITYVEVD